MIKYILPVIFSGSSCENSTPTTSNTPARRMDTGPSPSYAPPPPSPPPPSPADPQLQSPMPQHSPRSPPAKRRRLAPARKNLNNIFSEQVIKSRRNYHVNVVVPVGVSAVSTINSNCRHLAQVTKSLSKINLSGLKLLAETAPAVILSDRIERTFLPSHLMPYRSGVMKSCTLNISTQQLSLFEGDWKFFPNSLGIYVPTIFYDHQGQLVRLANVLCPYGQHANLRKFHVARKVDHFTICDFKVTAVLPPTEYPATPEGILCKEWHARNLEVINNIPNFPQSLLEKSTGKFLLLPAMPLLANTVRQKKWMLLQISMFARLYSHEELKEMVSWLTHTHGDKLSELTAVSSISVREIITFMPNGVICVVIPSRICYKLTFSELSRLLILSTEYQN